MKKITITLLLTAFLLGNQALAQVNTKAIKDKLENYFKNYKPEGAQFSRTAHLDDYSLTTTMTVSLLLPMMRLLNRVSPLR